MEETKYEKALKLYQKVLDFALETVRDVHSGRYESEKTRKLQNEIYNSIVQAYSRNED